MANRDSQTIVSDSIMPPPILFIASFAEASLSKRIVANPRGRSDWKTHRNNEMSREKRQGRNEEEEPFHHGESLLLQQYHSYRKFLLNALFEHFSKSLSPEGCVDQDWHCDYCRRKRGNEPGKKISEAKQGRPGSRS
jgi:hypothetical protein